jgi:hypothetical protein
MLYRRKTLSVWLEFQYKAEVTADHILSHYRELVGQS